MKGIFYRFPKNLLKCFWGRNIFWHVLAIILTYFLVTFGFDWSYYQATRIPTLNSLFFPAVLLGGLLPFLIPAVLLVVSAVKKSFQAKNTAFVLAQSAIIGLIIAAFYKSITGRAHPAHEILMSVDITRIFNFGPFTNGIFWGWPSTHTTIAFAMAVSLVMIYPKNKILKVLAIAYALYVGIGVSMTIHWFSDFIAGIIFGSLVGYIVGKSFLGRYAALSSKN